MKIRELTPVACSQKEPRVKKQDQEQYQSGIRHRALCWSSAFYVGALIAAASLHPGAAYGQKAEASRDPSSKKMLNLSCSLFTGQSSLPFILEIPLDGSAEGDVIITSPYTKEKATYRARGQAINRVDARSQTVIQFQVEKIEPADPRTLMNADLQIIRSAPKFRVSWASPAAEGAIPLQLQVDCEGLRK